jgi:hypothetical protein
VAAKPGRGLDHAPSDAGPDAPLAQVGSAATMVIRFVAMHLFQVDAAGLAQLIQQQ